MDFNYDERNPIKILDQVKNQSIVKNSKDFEVLYEFIQYRIANPDPRFSGIMG